MAMANLDRQIAEKAATLRGLYGGAMSLRDLRAETGHGYYVTLRWAERHRLGRKIGKRTTYDTDAVARALVMEREFS